MFGLAALIAIVLALGTVAYHLVEGWNFLESFYMTLMTVTTVGYGEPHPLSRPGMVLTSVVMLAGVLTVFISVGVVVDLIVKLELVDYFGRRRGLKMLEHISGHYIVCGAGRVGRSVARELKRSGAPVLMIDADPARLEWAARMEIPSLCADATADETLRQAKIDAAIGLVAATNSDAQNVYVALSAKVLNPTIMVVARASDEEAAEKLRRAGATTVLTPYSFIGHRLAQSLLRPHVLDFIDITSAGSDREDLGIHLAELPINGDSPLAGRTLDETGVCQAYGIIVPAVFRPSGIRFNPPGDLRLEPGDVLIAMGEGPGLKRLEDELGIASARN